MKAPFVAIAIPSQFAAGANRFRTYATDDNSRSTGCFVDSAVIR